MDSIFIVHHAGFNNTSGGFVYPTNSNVLPHCGRLPFCEKNVSMLCENITLKYCPACSMAAASLFLIIVILLGIIILIANGFIIFCTVVERPGFTGNYSIIKASLASADMITGIQLLMVIVYNFSWSINSTSRQLEEQEIFLRGKPAVSFGSFLHFLGYCASLDHLLLLATQRLYAITQPMKYKLQKKRTVYALIACTWVLSTLTASAMLWFPQYFVTNFMPSVLNFGLAVYAKSLETANATALLFLAICCFLVPFSIMTLTTIITAIFTKTRLAKQWKNLHPSDQQREQSVYYTLFFMQIGYTITLVPLVVVTILLYSKSYSCSELNVPYTVCFYLSVSNSFVNVVIYSARDNQFRNAVRYYGKMCINKKDEMIGALQRPPNKSSSRPSSRKEQTTYI